MVEEHENVEDRVECEGLAESNAEPVQGSNAESEGNVSVLAIERLALAPEGDPKLKEQAIDAICKMDINRSWASALVAAMPYIGSAVLSYFLIRGGMSNEDIQKTLSSFGKAIGSVQKLVS